MSTPKIYGNAHAICTQRVLFTAAVIKAPYELVSLNMQAGEHRSPEHLARQPFGKVPALVEGDFNLYESRAICRYLVNKQGGNEQLLPTKDLKAAALFEQWACTEQSSLSDNLGIIMLNTQWYKFKGIPRDESAYTKAHENIKIALSVLDTQLSKNQFILGSSLSLVDIWLAPIIGVLSPEEAKILVDAYPNISAWWKRIQATEGWKAVQQIKNQQ